MKKLTLKWVKYAEIDLEGATIALGSKKNRYSSQLCILHCHQALEKILKSILVEKNKTVKRTHDLLSIANDTKLNLPNDYLEFIKVLNPHYGPARYPDIIYNRPIIRYSKSMARLYFQKTKEIFLWVKKYLNHRK